MNLLIYCKCYFWTSPKGQKRPTLSWPPAAKSATGRRVKFVQYLLRSPLGQWQFLSAVDFERSQKAILLAFELRKFLHSQGQRQTYKCEQQAEGGYGGGA